MTGMTVMELDTHPRPAAPPPARYEGGEGRLTALVRIPVRIVVLLVVLPVRLLWDALVVGARGFRRVLLRPLGRALTWVYETLLAPVGRAVAWFLGRVLTYGLVVPVSWLYRRVLTPLGHGVAWLVEAAVTGLGAVLAAVGGALAWLVTTLLVAPLAWCYRTVLVPVGRGTGLLLWAVCVWPWTALYRWVLTPLGHALAWLGERVLAPVGRGAWSGLGLLARWLVGVPAVFVYRWVLSPVGRGLVAVGREIVAAVGVAWRIAGHVSRAVGRALKWLAWILVGRPAAWFYRNVCTPVGHVVRDALWRPARRAAAEAGRVARAALSSARETVRQARQDAWRALVGGSRRAEPVEPGRARARTLGSTTSTAPGAAPATETALRKQG
ncbi:hypothetical protein [Streptomyces sp. NPDC047928]|uniref:hypothetical protein n=1 Tax=unclassified Streptomyces TaxID=2593676 RepID=UPI003722BECA